MSDSLWPHGLQHSRLLCPSLSPRVCSNSHPLSQWCHPAILFSVVPFSCCTQSFPSNRVFSRESALYIRWPKYWSLSFSISPSNEYSELISVRIGWFDFLTIQSFLRIFSGTAIWKHQFCGLRILNAPALISIHNYWQNHGLYRPLLTKWCLCCLIPCLGLW